MSPSPPMFNPICTSSVRPGARHLSSGFNIDPSQVYGLHLQGTYALVARGEEVYGEVDFAALQLSARLVAKVPSYSQYFQNLNPLSSHLS